MRSVLLLSLALLAFTVSAQTNRVINGNQLAYYGADFYKSKITKDLIYKILSETHSMVTGAAGLHLLRLHR